MSIERDRWALAQISLKCEFESAGSPLIAMTPPCFCLRTRHAGAAAGDAETLDDARGGRINRTVEAGWISDVAKEDGAGFERTKPGLIRREPVYSMSNW